MSLAVWNAALTPARLDLGDWLHTEMVYLVYSHPSQQCMVGVEVANCCITSPMP